METNTSSENILNQSFSKKEVRFCDKTSILYYTIEDSVESLNNSAISMMNENSLCPSTCSMLKNSSEVTSSLAECISNECLDNLPEAVVILEKISEDLIEKHGYLDSGDIECCPVPMAIQSTDKSCSLNSDLLYEKLTESVESQTSVVFEKEKHSLLNFKVSIPRLPDNFREIYECHVSEKYASETCSTIRMCSKNPGNKVSKLNGIVKNAKTKSRKISRNQNIKHSECTQHSLLQNSFDRLPSPSKIVRSKCADTNRTQVIGNTKSVDSNASVFKKYITSQENPKEVTFDKYPCIHLEKLDLGPYLKSISHSLDYFQSKNGVPKNSKLDMENAANISDFSKPKESAQLNEDDCFKTLSLSAPVTGITCTENDTDIFRLSKPEQSVQLSEDICSITVNFSALVINVDSAENAPNISDISKLEKSAPTNEGVCPKNINVSSIIDTEGDTTNTSGLSKQEKNVLLNKEVGSESAKSVLPACYKKSFREKSLQKNESIVKDTNCENSSLYKNAQNNAPHVLLERLPLPLVEMHMNYDKIFSESTCTGSVTNVSSSTNLVATITDMPDLPIQIKNVCSISKKKFNKKRKEDKKISSKSSLFYKHQFKENRAGVVKHKSECSTSVQTFKNVHSISDDSSNEDEIPLLSVSKKKLINEHSFPYSEDSSSDDTSLGNLANTNASLAKAKAHKRKKKKLMHNNQKCISAMKNRSPSLQTLCNISKKMFNKKCRKDKKISNKSSLFYKHQFKENRAGIVKHKSECSTSIQTFKNVHSISDDSSNEDEIPLISISKKKLINEHSFPYSDDSSSDDTSLENLANTNASLAKAKSSSISDHRRKKKNLMRNNQKCISAMKNKSPSLQTLCNISKKILKNKKCSKSVELSHSEKKKKKKSLRKKRLKIYNMIMKYLKIQIKSKKHKKKSKKSLQENSKKFKGVKLVSSVHNSIESDDSIAMIYDSNEKKKDCAKNKNGDSSSTSEKKGNTKLHKKLNDKYRLGFLSNKVSLRFYNRFLASERLLLSKSKLKKNKKKELKKIFNRLKAAGLASKFV